MEFDKSAFDEFIVKKSEIPEVNFDVNVGNYERENQLFDILSDLKKVSNWSNVRDAMGNFILDNKEYSFGSRMVYAPSTPEKYDNLQKSRNIEICDDGLRASLTKLAANSSQLNPSDNIRIKEITAVVDKIRPDLNVFAQQATPEDMEALTAAFTNPNSGFAHFGIKSFNLLNYYSHNGYKNCFGYDISELTVGLCNKAGFKGIEYDPLCDDSFDLSQISLIVTYHTLECLPDPLKFLKRLASSAAMGTKFHTEVTIEPGVPRLRYGHLYPFEKGDLQAMLKEAGFIPLSYSNIPHPGGPEIERILSVVK